MLQRRKRARAGLGRAALQPQVEQQLGHVVDRDARHPPAGKGGQQLAVELVAVRLERARVALTGRDPRLEALKPAARDGVEAKVRRARHGAGLDRRDRRGALVTRGGEVEADRPKPQPARAAAADGVLAVGLAVDAALDADAARCSHACSLRSLVPWHGPRLERPKLTES
jgi:hypothetical protein